MLVVLDRIAIHRVFFKVSCAPYRDCRLLDMSTNFDDVLVGLGIVLLAYYTIDLGHCPVQYCRRAVLGRLELYLNITLYRGVDCGRTLAGDLLRIFSSHKA